MTRTLATSSSRSHVRSTSISGSWRRTCRRRTGSLFRTGRRLEDEDDHAVADGLRVGETQRLLVARLAEEALSASEHDRVHHQPQLVDEVALEQRLHQPRAPVDDDVPFLRLLQLADLLRDVALHHG